MRDIESNYFSELNSVDVQGKVEEKNGFKYLSWAYAWGELKKRHPDATYTVYENTDGLNYHTDGRTCWVKTGVTVNGIEHIEYLPVMDHRNKSIALNSVTSYDVNKSIQRRLTKAVARHGLGLYVYAGEDIPGEENARPAPAQKQLICPNCGEPVKPQKKPDGVIVPAEAVMKGCGGMCYSCYKKAKESV